MRVEMTTFYLTIYIILFWSGWFQSLPFQLGVSKQTWQGCLLLLFISSLLPAIKMTPLIQISVLFLLLFMMIFWMLCHLKLEQLLSLLTTNLISATVLIGFHELFTVQLDWEHPMFTIIVTMLILMHANFSLSDLRVKIIYQWGTLFMFYFSVLILYQDRLNPIYIGDEQFVARGLLLTGCMLLIHQLLPSVDRVAQRLRNR